MTGNRRKVRAATVAGTFYIGDAESLSLDVDQLLQSVDTAPCSGVRMLLSPHAGYPYSGRIAAHGFRAISESGAHTIIIIGPSHTEYFRHTSVFLGSAYETPLGEVPVNTEIAQVLCEHDASICATDNGHIQTTLSRGEHSIEVQLPFLQRILPGVSIVPIVMGNQEWDACQALGDGLKEACKDTGVVILASSDLSHFYTHEKASTLDAIFCDALATLNPRTVHDAVTRGECEACGVGPVTSALLALEDTAAHGFHLLARASSGDITGDHSNVVGYASAVVAAG